jgi:hypothetical protein
MTIIPALRKMRWEDNKLNTSLGYTMRPGFKKEKEHHQNIYLKFKANTCVHIHDITY